MTRQKDSVDAGKKFGQKITVDFALRTIKER